MKLLLVLIALNCSVRVYAGAISLSVEQKSEVESKGKTNDNKTQSRTLKISMSNLGREEVNVSVRYFFFAREMKTGEESVMKRGSKIAALPANSEVKIESETVTSSFVEEHSEIEKGKGGKGKKNNSKLKKVAASGNRITGYAVQVVQGNAVVASYYSSPSIEQKLAARP
jgi:hypothetical protein